MALAVVEQMMALRDQIEAQNVDKNQTKKCHLHRVNLTDQKERVKNGQRKESEGYGKNPTDNL